MKPNESRFRKRDAPQLRILDDRDMINQTLDVLASAAIAILFLVMTRRVWWVPRVVIVLIFEIYAFGYSATVPFRVGHCEVPYTKIYLARHLHLFSSQEAKPWTRTQSEMLECLCQQPREALVIVGYINQSFCNKESPLYDLCGATDAELICKLRR
jgi:hypothetical protein